MTTARSDVQGYALSARVELYVLDTTVIGGTEVFRFHAGLNQVKTNIVWQGDTYAAYPIAGSGFDRTGQGTIPRPKVQLANIAAYVSALCETYDDLVGAQFTRKIVLAKYLDAVNFPGGVNPDASPDGAFPDEIWNVFRKTSESSTLIEFELCAPFDVEGVVLPGRQVRVNNCVWLYRSAECSYAGGAVAKIDDTPTSDPDLDKCGKRLTSCQLRFPSGTLPYGAFPGCGTLLQ